MQHHVSPGSPSHPTELPGDFSYPFELDSHPTFPHAFDGLEVGTRPAVEPHPPKLEVDGQLGHAVFHGIRELRSRPGASSYGHTHCYDIYVAPTLQGDPPRGVGLMPHKSILASFSLDVQATINQSKLNYTAETTFFFVSERGHKHRLITRQKLPLRSAPSEPFPWTRSVIYPTGHGLSVVCEPVLAILRRK